MSVRVSSKDEAFRLLENIPQDKLLLALVHWMSTDELGEFCGHCVREELIEDPGAAEEEDDGEEDEDDDWEEEWEEEVYPDEDDPDDWEEEEFIDRWLPRP